jgi:hypothetical protein
MISPIRLGFMAARLFQQHGSHNGLLVLGERFQHCPERSLLGGLASCDDAASSGGVHGAAVIDHPVHGISTLSATTTSSLKPSSF